MNRKAGFILGAEEYFGSRTALGSMVRRPVNHWLQIIPGMFIYEAYKRSRERRLFARHFMYPRRTAMQLAVHAVEGGDPDELSNKVAQQVQQWLRSAEAYSEATFEAVMALVDRLRMHYEKLLHAEGSSYAELVTAVYESRDRYEAYLHEISQLEDAVDRAVLEKFGYEESLREEFRRKQETKKHLREKDTDAIF